MTSKQGPFQLDLTGKDPDALKKQLIEKLCVLDAARVAALRERAKHEADDNRLFMQRERASSATWEHDTRARAWEQRADAVALVAEAMLKSRTVGADFRATLAEALAEQKELLEDAAGKEANADELAAEAAREAERRAARNTELEREELEEIAKLERELTKRREKLSEDDDEAESASEDASGEESREGIDTGSRTDNSSGDDSALNRAMERLWEGTSEYVSTLGALHVKQNSDPTRYM